MIEQEKRRLERIRLTISLPVLEKESEKIIGSLEDINAQGVRLTCDEELKAGEKYSLSMELPAELDEGQTVSFNAECMWCTIDDTINVYHAGLQFQDADGEKNRIIGRLIERYGEG